MPATATQPDTATYTLAEVAEAAANGTPYGIKKPTKAEAFKILKDFISSGADIPYETAVSLYKFFQYTPPAKAGGTLSWLAQLLIKDDPKFHLHVFKVDAGRAYATDGHRIHMAGVKMDSGFYDKSGTAVADQGKTCFPLVGKLADEYRGMVSASTRVSQEALTDELVTPPQGTTLPDEMYRITCGTSVGYYDAKYIRDALAGAVEARGYLFKDGDTLLIEAVGPDGALREAIIMALRYDGS